MRLKFARICPRFPTVSRRRPKSDRLLAIDKQRAVVERRFGLDGREIATLEEVGLEIGVTRERVRQIQIEALRRLRHILEREGFSGDALLAYIF